MNRSPLALPRAWLALVLGLALLGGVTAALRRDPWDPDETRYLEVTRELVAGRNPFLLTFNGVPYADKPPLFFWLLAPAVALLGADSALAGMIPAALALVGLALAAARLGRTAGLDPEAARLGAVMTVTALLPAGLAAGCRMDLLFALWCVLALDRLVALTDEGVSRPARSHLLLWLWLALGVLTKGPIALALPLAAAAVLALRSSRSLRLAVSGWGLLLALAVVGAWLVPAALAGGRTWFENAVFRQTAGRIASSFAHREPWWFHLATVPLSLLPWSPAAVAAVAVTLARWRSAPLRLLLLAVYPATTLVGLSLVSGKTVLYPLPLFAPACVLAAAWLAEAPERGGRRVALAVGGGVVAVTGIGLGAVGATRADIALTLPAATLLALSWAVPAAVALGAALARRVVLATAALALAVPVFLAVGSQTLVPFLNRTLSVRPLAVALAAADPRPDLPALAYDRPLPGYLLYSGRRFAVFTTPEELRQALASGRPVAIEENMARVLERDHGLRFSVAARVPYRHAALLLVSEPRDPSGRGR